MRQMEIRAQLSKPWTITTKDSDFSTELQNILDEQFNPDRPNAVWCSDITYIWTIDGFVYLTSIIDLISLPLHQTFFLRPLITKRSEGKIQWANAKNFIFCFCLSHIQKKNGVFTGSWRIIFYFYAKK